MSTLPCRMMDIKTLFLLVLPQEENALRETMLIQISSMIKLRPPHE
jgi:hypothetical protein